MIDLRCGRYQDVLADVGEVDALIVDPPYSARTHGGQRHGRYEADGVGSGNWVSVRGIEYPPWTPEDVAAFVAAWASRTRGWLVALTSHDLAPAWEQELRAAGRYVFAPLPCVLRGMNIRLAGDGPSSWCVWAIVARPAALHRWGTLPGAYVGDGGQGRERSMWATAGAKPLWLMRAIVRDYSRPGDLVCDPCAGGGTTALACYMEGRRVVGAECDPATYAKARQRIDAVLAQGELPIARTAEQRRLFGGER